ncbi:helix-turn-helix transcriptional regulator [Anaerosalibacter bizertensis]|uniref:Helix-turn-helix transcriptional regulator n=1 Tax=Anaerosalibacter bizertensis TaxID=932217 RepID=A0A844FHK4_9FIRM|nr:helix-turn-helix transcriptional regulator [Anaerosalibacter bizertensis]MSS43395.1 helix-turn-helix transcriptional regulator [Anaerosalibacter bizertensis]
MISGEKLKKLRLLRELTQKELAIKSDLTDSAIRNYELGYRSPNKKQLLKIAEALECDVSALIDHTPISVFEFMQILFDYEDDLKIKPLIEESSIGLISHDENFNDFLVEWDEMRKKHYNEEITDDEFEDWKLSYPKKSRLKNNY